MDFPVRCFTCGKVIVNKLRIIEKKIQKDDSQIKQILDELGFYRICCRRMFIGYLYTC